MNLCVPRLRGIEIRTGGLEHPTAVTSLLRRGGHRAKSLWRLALSKAMVGLFFVGGLNPDLADRDKGRFRLVVRGFAVSNNIG